MNQGPITPVYKVALEGLHPESSDNQVNAVINSVLDANVSIPEMGRIEKQMKSLLEVNIGLIRKMIVQVKQKRQAERNQRTEDGKLVFRYKSEFNFDEAFAFGVRALVEENQKQGQPIYCCMSSQPVRLMTTTNEGRTSVRFDAIKNQSMWSELNDLLTFVRTQDGEDGHRRKVPEDVGTQVYEQAYRKLPQAPEVIYTPSFLANGTLVMKDGYYFDAARPDETNLLLVSNGLIEQMEKIAERPTAEQVQEAVNWIETELLSDFPFLDNDSKGNERREPSLANAFAMLLTPFMRRMIHGRTPVFFVHKPQPGTGGTLLGQLPMWLFDGESGTATRYSQSEEEMQKGLIAAVQEPHSHLFFDDVKNFNNRELLRAITQDNVSGRLLGASKNVTVPNRFNWIATGNNTIILDEMRRRVVFIRLNARAPDATSRIFRHPDISGMNYTQFVQHNRALAVRHILTMIQYWITIGQPKFTHRRRASFEDWSAKVGGVLQACGVEGFLDSFDEVATDLDGAADRQFIREFYKAFGTSHAQSANDLLDWAMDMRLEIISGANDDQKRSRFMKNSLLSLIDRTFKVGEDILMFQRAMDDCQNVVFRLVSVRTG